MSKQRIKRIENIDELLYKMTEKIEAYENGEIESEHLQNMVKASTAICGIIKTKVMAEQHIKKTSAMDFITANSNETKQIAANRGFNVMDIGNREELKKAAVPHAPQY